MEELGSSLTGIKFPRSLHVNHSVLQNMQRHAGKNQRGVSKSSAGLLSFYFFIYLQFPADALIHPPIFRNISSIHFVSVVSIPASGNTL